MNGNFEIYLTSYKRAFYAVAVILLLVAVASVMERRERLALEKTLESMNTVKSGAEKLKSAIENRKQVLDAMKQQVGATNATKSPEMILYEKIDDLKKALKPNDMTLSSMEKKGAETSMQYTITFNDPDYNDLLNNISYLHGSLTPLTPVNSIIISKGAAKDGVGITFKVAGKIITSEKAKP